MNATTALAIGLLLIAIGSFVLAKRNKQQHSVDRTGVALMALSVACFFGAIFVGVPQLPMS
jgi:LPXTG-motif cell wall-anchored protein